MVHFGDLVRQFRLRRAWTQEVLAERCGMSVHAISVLESGKRTPRVSSVHRIAMALDLVDADRQELIATVSGATGSAHPSSAPTPAHLPADLIDFVGRSEPAARLSQLLSAGNAVVLTAVGGPGGIGKTSLAVHVGHRLRARYPDGQLYVNLRAGSGSPLSATDVLARFLRGLGVDSARVPSDEDERGALYRSLLADRRVLVVLDDAADAAQVRPLLPGVGFSAVLITSRSRLAGLDGVHRITLDLLDEPEANALLSQILGPEAAATDPDAAAIVLRACAGLPLAIRLAAGRLISEPDWTLRTLADRLSNMEGRLNELTVEDRAVRASLAISYRRLSAESARAFRLLGLWQGPYLDLFAAAALINRTGSQTEELLGGLAGSYLLDEAGGRYTFHDLVRAYAAELAATEVTAAEQDRAVAGLLSWYLHTADAAGRLITPQRRHALDPHELLPPGAGRLEFASYDQALAWLVAEYPNLVTAHDTAADRRMHHIAWQLPIALWDLFNLRGHWQEWTRANQIGVVAARALGDTNAEARGLVNLGASLHLDGRVADAIEAQRGAHSLHERAGNLRGVASALYNLGSLYAEQDQDAAALDAFRRTLAIFREAAPYPFGEGYTLTAIGELHAKRGDPTTALEHYRQAITIQERLGDRRNEATSLTKAGQALRALGQTQEAIATLTRAVAVNTEVGHRHDEANARRELGQAHLDLGAKAVAETELTAALHIFHDLGHPEAIAVANLLATLHTT